MSNHNLKTTEKGLLRHKLTMYQQLSILHPLEHKYLQKQVELLLLLGENNKAKLLLEKLQLNFKHQNLIHHAADVKKIQSYLQKEQTCNQLYSAPFLHLASSNFLEKVFRKHRRKELQEGDYLMRYGERDTKMYILTQGSLAIWSRDNEENKYLEHIMHAGEIIGELAFLDNTPRTADVIACEPSTLLSIPEKEALKLCVEKPEIEQALRKEATTRRIQMDIQKNHALRRLPSSLKALLAQQGQYRSFKALKRIHQGNSPIQSIDLICKGHVRLLSERSDGSSLILNSLKQGSLLGCTAALPHMEKNYATDIVSMDSVRVIQFPIRFFCEIMATNPSLHQSILQQAELEQGSLLQNLHAKK